MRDADVVEGELAGVAGAHAELALDRAGRQTRHAPLEHEGGEPVVLQAAVERGEDQEVVGEVGERDPHLGAVEDVGVAVPDIGRLDRPGVGTGIWLGQREGAELFAAGLGHEKALLLLLIGPLQERQAVEPDVDAHDHPQEGVDVLQLLAGEGEGDVVEPGAAILLRDGKAEDAELAHLAQHLGVELALGIPLLDVWRDLARGELAHRVANLNLLGSQGEVHRADCPLPTLVENPRFGADSAMYRFLAKAVSSIAG